MAKNEKNTVESGEVAARTPFVPKLKQRLTFQLLKFKGTDPLYFKVNEKIVQSKKVVDDQKEPPHIAKVVDLETGEVCEMIFPAVLKSILEEQFPGDAYVGKSFSARKFDKANGKNYATFDVAELED